MENPHSQHKKVLLIGSSGMVGMATRDAITQYLGADVITQDRPSSDTAKREERIALYKQLCEKRTDTIDGKQEAWLLRHQAPLDETKQGRCSSVSNIMQGMLENPDCIVIAAGKPRTPEQKRTDVLQANAPFFEDLGHQIGDAFIERLQADPHYKIPVIINSGNPVDTMTEVLSRTIRARMVNVLAQIDTGDLADNEINFRNRLIDAIDSLPTKVIGQGGILDSSRAASAISNSLHIPIEDVISAPVVGTHNEKMVLDVEHCVIRHDGSEIPLAQYPKMTPERLGKIQEATQKGGGSVLNEYSEILNNGREATLPKLSQSAFLATGAANMIMVDAVVHDKHVELPMASFLLNHDGTDGIVVGNVAKLGINGAEQPVTMLDGASHATQTRVPLNVEKRHEYRAAFRGAVEDMAAAAGAVGEGHHLARLTSSKVYGKSGITPS